MDKGRKTNHIFMRIEGILGEKAQIIDVEVGRTLTPAFIESIRKDLASKRLTPLDNVIVVSEKYYRAQLNFMMAERRLAEVLHEEAWYKGDKVDE